MLESNGMEKGSKTGSFARHSSWAAKLIVIFNFFVSFVKGGVQPFIIVYLVAIRGWSPLEAGVLWSTREFTQMFVQAPVAAIIDGTGSKKLIMILAVIGCTQGAVVVMLTDNFYIHLIKTIIEGISHTIIDPCKAAITLGVVGHDDFDRVSGVNEMANHAGTLVIAGSAGVFAYFIYPNVEYVFFIVVACGVISFICILLIPEKGINHHVARNAKITVITTDTNDKENLLNPTDSEEEAEDVEETFEVEIQPCCSTLMDRNVLMFALSIFLFHMSNAAVLPLLGQLGGVKGATRSALPFISSCIVIGKISAIPASWMVMRLSNKVNKKILLSLGFASLFPRCASIALISLYGNHNIYLLASTQLMDGVGAGICGLSVITYVRALTMGTGRFSAVFGVIDLMISIGASVSNLLGGFLANQSYEFAFIVLGALSILPILTLMFGVDAIESSDRNALLEHVDSEDESTENAQKGIKMNHVRSPKKKRAGNPKEYQRLGD